MALDKISATVGGLLQKLIIGIDGSGNIAPAHVIVDASGSEKATVGNPLIVALPNGAALASKQAAPGTVGTPSTDVLSIQPAAGKSLPTIDASGAAFQGVTSLVPGTPGPAQRSIGFICTGAGSITLTLADASMITLPIGVNGGFFQTLPLAVTNVTLGSGTAATFWNLK